MSENVLQALQKLVQDVIAPDVRELKVRVDGAISESKAQSELARMTAVASPLHERVAVLESKHN